MTHHIYINNTAARPVSRKHYELELDICDDINIYGADSVQYSPTSSMVFVHAYYNRPVDIKIESTERGHDLGRYTEVTIRPKE